jgi:hypothetical protein
MYYEERLIDGVLHWRGTPDGEWVAVSAERLSSRVVEAETWRREVTRTDADDLCDLRDWFAGLALQAVVGLNLEEATHESDARYAYNAADAMMKVRTSLALVDGPQETK